MADDTSPEPRKGYRHGVLGHHSLGPGHQHGDGTSGHQHADAGRAPGWIACSAATARAYDRTAGRLLGGLYRAVAADVRRATAGNAPARVVDAGAGPGSLVVALAGALPDAVVCAVDVDPEMAARARDRVVRDGLTDRVAIVIGDVLALPLPEGTQDLVVSTLSVHHWPDAARGFAEVRRVLRPGGRALIYDVPDWWSRRETHAPPLLDAARAGGFDEARVDRLAWPGPLRIVARLDLTTPGPNA